MAKIRSVVEGVNWDLVDDVLPTDKIPSAQAARSEIFNKMDNNHKGSLTLTQVQAGLPSLLDSDEPRKAGEKAKNMVGIEDFRPACKCAFKVAKDIHPSEKKGQKKKKEDDNMVDRAEFHALLVAFRLYIELDVIFGAIDASGQRSLSFKECEKALPILEEWGLKKSDVRNKFTDDWAESMKFEDFADWLVARRLGGLNLTLDENDAEDTLQDAAGSGNTGKMLKAFEQWDSDGSGHISPDELAFVLMELDPNFNREQADQLFLAADSNTDGVIDWKEFVAWVSSG